VLGVILNEAELEAVFDYFDEDGGGTITYDEILIKFHRRDYLEIGKVEKKKRRVYRSGIEFRKVNIDRVERRRKRELDRQRIREERRKLRSAKTRRKLRAQFEEKLENRIALGKRAPRKSIMTHQHELMKLHETQPKGLRQNSQTMLRKSMDDVTMSRVKARPPTPPQKPEVYTNAEILLGEWITCLKTIFQTYVKYQLSFAKTKKYDFDEMQKTKKTIDETSWLRMLTDFNIVPQLLSKYDAKGIYHRSNLTLSPNKADTKVVAQERPIGQRGPMQYKLLDFNDFIGAIVGLAHSRASFFACHSTSQEKCDALLSWMRDVSIEVNKTKEIKKYYNKKKVVSGSVDIGNYLSHGLDAPSYIWRLRRTWGCERAENTQRNAWLHFETPTFSYEWRYSDQFRQCLQESVWIATEMVDLLLNKAVPNLHILHSTKVDKYHQQEKDAIEKIANKIMEKDEVSDPTEDDMNMYLVRARKRFIRKRKACPYRLYKNMPSGALYGEIPTVRTIDGSDWVPPSERFIGERVPKHVGRLHEDPKHDKLREMSNEKFDRLNMIDRTMGQRASRTGVGFGSRTYYANRAPMDEEAMKKWESHSTMRKKYFNRDARVDRLAFLGEKSRSKMTMSRQVTARWATEFIVRIADECTTGEAKVRILEKCDFDGTKEVPIDRWVAKYILSRRNGDHLVGLPRYPEGHPMLTLEPPPVPELSHNATEKAVDRKLRADVLLKKKQKIRELNRKKRQAQLRKELEQAKINRKKAEIVRMADESAHHHAEQARKFHEKQARKAVSEHNKIDIDIYRKEKSQRIKKEKRNREYVEDVANRNYSIHIQNSRKFVSRVEKKSYTAKRVSPREAHDHADDHTGFNIEEMNQRRADAKKRRIRAVKAMEKAKEKEQAELEKLEERFKYSNNPVDKLSLKLTIALKKNSTKLSDIFARMDLDGSGTVTYKEFRRGLFEVGIKLNTKEVTELCQALDKDGDGDVSYLELKRFMDNSKNNEHAAAASIQARWRTKRIKMKTKAELKEDYRQKVLKEQQDRLELRTKRWKEDMAETSHILEGENEYNAQGRRIKGSPSRKRKAAIPRQSSKAKSVEEETAASPGNEEKQANEEA
jgi:Ca2+-binding EF-hand superfamily protein